MLHFKNWTKPAKWTAGILVVLVIASAAGSGSGSSSKTATTTPTKSAAPDATTTSPASGGPGVTAEEAFNMDASCENVHPAEHAKCEHLYAGKKLEEEGHETEAVLKHRQAEQTASNLEAIAQAQEENES